MHTIVATADAYARPVVEDLEEEQRERDSSFKALAARVATLQQKHHDRGARIASLEKKHHDHGLYLDNVIRSIVRRLSALERGAQL